MNTGGMVAVVNNLVSIIVIFFLFGIVLEPISCCGGECPPERRKYFGYHEIPFNHQERRRLDA